MKTADFMWLLAARAKVLADQPIDALRIAVGSGDLPRDSIRQNKHKSRGELIEELLTEEFEPKAKAIDEENEQTP